MRNGLALDRADHHPLIEVFLQEGIHAHDRNGRDNDDGVPHQIGEPERDLRRFAGPHARLHLIGDQDVAQHELQGMQVRIFQIDQSIEIRVPVTDGDPKPQHRDDRLGQGQHDLGEITEVAATVDLRRLPQVLGNARLKKRSSDDDIVHDHGKWEDHDQKRIVQMEIPDRQKGRDESAAEKHRKDEKQGKELPSDEILPRQRVRRRHVDDQADGRARYRIQYRVSVPDPNVFVLEQLFVAVQGKPLGNEPYLPVRHRRRIAEGSDDDKVKRIHQDDQKHGGKNVKQHFHHFVGRAVVDRLRGRASYRIGCVHLHLLLSSTISCSRCISSISGSPESAAGS